MAKQKRAPWEAKQSRQWHPYVRPIAEITLYDLEIAYGRLGKDKPAEYKVDLAARIVMLRVTLDRLHNLDERIKMRERGGAVSITCDDLDIIKQEQPDDDNP